METYRTPLTHDEIKELQDNLSSLIASQGSYVMHHFADIDWGTKNLMQYSKLGQVVKFYQGDKFCGIVCFDVGRSWWTTALMISEVIVLSTANTHGLQRYALRELEKIAKETGAQLIVGGCIFMEHPQMITNGYKKCGFHLTYPTYAKVIDNDNK